MCCYADYATEKPGFSKKDKKFKKSVLLDLFGLIHLQILSDLYKNMQIWVCSCFAFNFLIFFFKCLANLHSL
jgi:hypothetical protein